MILSDANNKESADNSTSNALFEDDYSYLNSLQNIHQSEWGGGVIRST